MSVVAAKKSKYEGVYLVRDEHMCQYWLAHGVINDKKHEQKRDTEREAAIAYDLILINNGIHPVNIYK